MTEPNPRAIAPLRNAQEAAGVVLLAPHDMHEGGHGVRLRRVEP